jgi:cytochrome c-type biogenesis protein CcmH/NrfF
VRILLAAALALALAAPALASEQHPTQAELEAELVCEACHLPLDMSNSPIAQQMKKFVRDHIAMGWTKSQIEDALVEQLGPGVLGVPRRQGFDLLALAAAAWAWSRNRPTGGSLPPEPVPQLDPELDRRVDEELARFDA